jgi:predicted nucleotidyltransferase
MATCSCVAQSVRLQLTSVITSKNFVIDFGVFSCPVLAAPDYTPSLRALILGRSPSSLSEQEELKSVARNCITRHHIHHYMNFANTQWELLEKQQPPTVKTLLYVYRVLLTGIYLMQTGEVEANLTHLTQEFCLPYIEERIVRKAISPEKGALSGTDLTFHRQEVEQLKNRLQHAHEKSSLPEAPSARRDLNDLLFRLRTTFTC